MLPIINPIGSTCKIKTIGLKTTVVSSCQWFVKMSQRNGLASEINSVVSMKETTFLFSITH